MKENVAMEKEEFKDNLTAIGLVKAEGPFKSSHLLPKEYGLLKGFSIPVGITNKDMEIEGLEPKNAKKLSIDGAQGKGKLNLYVFRPAEYKDGEKTRAVQLSSYNPFGINILISIVFNIEEYVY